MLDFIDQQGGDTYGWHVKDFTSWLRETGADLDQQAVIDYFVRLNASDYSAGTVRVKRQAVKKRLRQLARAGGLGSDLSRNLDQFLKDVDREGPTKAPSIQAAPIERSKYLTADEYERVVAACRGPRQTMLIRFLWTTGCRVSELVGIRRADWKVEDDRVLIRVLGKGHKERTVRIPRALFDEIRDVFRGELFLFETSRGRAYNRSYISNQIAKVSKRAIGRSVRAHALRHSFATRQIRRTGKIQAVSAYLGHSSPAITLAYYCHESLDDSELFEDDFEIVKRYQTEATA
jgi:integrase